jgi:hypothetical protein
LKTSQQRMNAISFCRSTSNATSMKFFHSKQSIVQKLGMSIKLKCFPFLMNRSNGAAYLATSFGVSGDYFLFSRMMFAMRQYSTTNMQDCVCSSTNTSNPYGSFEEKNQTIPEHTIISTLINVHN